MIDPWSLICGGYPWFIRGFIPAVLASLLHKEGSIPLCRLPCFPFFNIVIIIEGRKEGRRREYNNDNNNNKIKK